MHGSTGGKIIDETAPYDPSPIVAFRVDCERRVKAAADRGVRSIVLSPAFVYGHGGGIPALWFESARDYGIVRYVGDGHNHWTTVHVDDLADLYLRALTDAAGGIGLLRRSGQARPSARRGAGSQRRRGDSRRSGIRPLRDGAAIDRPAGRPADSSINTSPAKKPSANWAGGRRLPTC